MEIDDPMAPEIFDQLTACDPELAWELCRNYVGYQLFGQEGIAVPFLDEAYHIVPFGVVAKKPPKGNVISATLRRINSKSTYCMIGSLGNLAHRNTDCAPFKQKPMKVNDIQLNKQFVYRVTGMKNGVKKVIKIKIFGVECFDVSLSVELGRLVLNNQLSDLHSVKKIFIIYAVFYASSLSVSVTIGEHQPGSRYLNTSNRKFKHDKRVPIGFIAQKFPLMSNGCVGFMEASSCDGLRNGRWQRSKSRMPSDLLPTTPANEPGPSWALAARRNPRDDLPAVPRSRNHPLPDTPDEDSTD